jgi:hypothetical protein
MTLPDRSTSCTDCVRAGHLCRAMVFVNGEPLCLACADGESCSHTATWTPLKSYVLRGQEVRMSQGVVMGPELIDPWACQQAKRPRDPAGRGPRKVKKKKARKV